MRALPTVAERRWVSGCNGHYKFVLGVGAPACPAYRQAGGRQESKNHDELINYTVRISRLFFELIKRLALIAFIFIRSMIYSASL